MRRLILTGCMAVAGCRQLIGIEDPLQISPDAQLDGAMVDAAPDTTPLSCYGSVWPVCLAAPTLPVTLTPQTIDTTNSPSCAVYTSAALGDACVIAGTTISMAAGTVLVTGNRPLVLVATDTLSVPAGATIDVASHSGGTLGPGADPPACVAGVAPAGAGGTGGGGYGGSFGGLGGNGGDGGSGGSKGTRPAITAPMVLRGGCAGSDGAGVVRGRAGHGGGALLVVAVTITIDGAINASGSTASGAPAGGAESGGGGGGGSGGMIVFDTTALTINGRVWAHGGGAGEGGSAVSNGNNGGESTGPAAQAVGGSGGVNNGGDGGGGSVSATTSGGNGGSGLSGTFGSGGGGGGGAGVIRVFATSSIGTTDITKVAPPPS